MPRPKSQKTLDKEAAAAEEAKAKIDAAADNDIADEGVVSPDPDGSGMNAGDIEAADKAVAETAEAADKAVAETDALLDGVDALIDGAADVMAGAGELLSGAEAKAKEAEAKAKEAEVTTETVPLADDSPWHVVEEQSDEDTTIEVCNVSTGFQMPAAILLRCRIDGKIVGDVKLMTGLKVKQIKGIWKLQ